MIRILNNFISMQNIVVCSTFGLYAENIIPLLEETNRSQFIDTDLLKKLDKEILEKPYFF